MSNTMLMFLMVTWCAAFLAALVNYGELRRTRNELERVRMQLVLCGTISLANTWESLARAIQGVHPDYWSAMGKDVYESVKREIKERERAERAEARCVSLDREREEAITGLAAECEVLRTHCARPTCAWTMVNPEHGQWMGGCKAEWLFTEGGPKENDMRFCPECGGAVVLA